MWAAASTPGGVGGVSQKVGKEFAEADPGGKLPKYVKPKKAVGGEVRQPPQIHIHLPAPPPIIMLARHPGGPGEEEGPHEHKAFGGPPTLGALHLPHASEDPIKAGLPAHIKAPAMPKDAGVSGLGGMGVKPISGGGGGGGGGMGRAGGMSMSQENPWWERSEARHLQGGGGAVSQDSGDDPNPDPDEPPKAIMMPTGRGFIQAARDTLVNQPRDPVEQVFNNLGAAFGNHPWGAPIPDELNLPQYQTPFVKMVDRFTGDVQQSVTGSRPSENPPPPDTGKFRRFERPGVREVEGGRLVNSTVGPITDDEVAASADTAQKAGGRTHLQEGGMSMSQENPWWERADANQINDVPFHQGGMIGGTGGGRTDRLPLVVPAEAHVIPADVMSALGQGNSAHGGPVLEAALGGGTGPYNTKIPAAHIAHTIPRPPPVPRGAISEIAEGGRMHEPTSILAASGEFVVRPDQVEALGKRAIQQGMAKKGEDPIMAGHRLLDEMIANVRKFQIQWLKQAPPPKKKDGGAVGGMGLH
jgi:hypothetical protein